MSDTHSNEPDLRKKEANEPAESQTAAASANPAAPPTVGTTSPLAGVDAQKLLTLLRNPTASQSLQPQTEWIYGAIGAASGVIGFALWSWLFREAIKSKLGIFDSIGRLMMTGAFGGDSTGKALLLGLFSIALLIGSLTLVGNWLGTRKLDWKEAVANLGGTQLAFGAAWLVTGLLSFISLQLSMLLCAFLLLVNLALLVGLAENLHEVRRERKFFFIVYSLAAYLLLMYLVSAIFG